MNDRIYDLIADKHKDMAQDGFDGFDELMKGDGDDRSD